ncbi:MAG: tRNA lysidine(34) synthetase TilS [Clostridiales bacterium]|nr:tRNA lysidine(34) synthetase TilS [Clostridiales bacterium]
MSIINIAEQTIKEYDLISPRDRVLVGLSGGADSVALLHILYELSERLGITLAAAHVNHSLRPTADRDMEFCRKLCEELQIEFYSMTADIKSGAANASMSEELYARQVRYDFFSSLSYDKIATAHNKNDAAETILFNFMRGASIRGLSGIPYKRGNIIRPILNLTKKQITDFCNNNGYEYMTDETNLEAVYTRNKIRLGLIPNIETEYNPNFVNVVTENAALISEDSDYLDNAAKKYYHGRIILSELSCLENPIKRRILQQHYKKTAGTHNNLSAKYINNILMLINHGTTGQKTELPGGFEARIQYGELIISPKQTPLSYEYKIYPGTLLKIPEIGKNVLITPSEGGGIFLDNTEGLVVRSKKTGDVFYPVGMTGKKKLSDYFTDKKIALSERGKIPLLVQDGRIVSVIGMRNDRRFTNEKYIEYKIVLKEINDAE